MAKRFLLFVVFAIVTQNSVLLSSATFDSFSKDGFDILNQLTYDNLRARSKSINGWNSFFNLLKNGAGQNGFFYPPSKNVNLTTVAKALSTVAVTNDIIFNSALTVIVKCDLYESALNESRARLNASFANFIGEIALAQGASATPNSSETKISSTGPTLFGLLRSCIKNYSYDLEDLIKEIEKKLKLNFGVITTAVREAIETYGRLISGINLNDEETFAALISMEKNRITVISTVIDNLGNIFSLYETSFINTYLNGTNIVPKIFLVQLTQKIISTKLEEMVKVVFVQIRNKLLEYTTDTKIGSYCIGDELIVTNVSEAIAARLLQDANDRFLETASLVLPIPADFIALAETILPRVLTIIINLYYDGIVLAEGTVLHHPLNLWAIKYNENLQNRFADFVIDKYFKIIGSEANTETRLTKLHENVVDNLQQADKAIFRTIEVLARVVRAKKGTNRNDFDNVCNYEEEAISAVKNVAKFQLYAILYKLIVDSGY